MELGMRNPIAPFGAFFNSIFLDGGHALEKCHEFVLQLIFRFSVMARST